jgi:hypothetical protein
MPETNYEVILKQEAGDRTVLKTDVKLSLNGLTNINYRGFGSAGIGGIFMKDRLKAYDLFYNGKQVLENSYFSNVPTGITHNLVVVENIKTTNCDTNFDIYDNQVKWIYPGAGPYGQLHAVMLSLDFDYASLLIEYFPFDRYFFCGAGAGFYTGAGIYYISPEAEAGYYLIGDMNYAFRLGAGITGRANLAFSGQGSLPPSAVPALFDAGVFISLEYYFITVRPECLFYNNNGIPGLGFGVAAGLHF